MKAIWILTLLMSLSAGAEELLRVKPYIVVAPNVDVKLSQLVDPQGASPDLMSKLSQVSISVSPAYGEKQEIANAAITAALRPFVQDARSQGRKNLMLVVPKSVTIDTQRRLMTADQVSGELMQTWQPLCGDCRLEIDGLSLPKVEGIRDWTLRLKGELPKGSFSIPVDLVKDDNTIFSAWISGRLVTKRKVPVAKRLMNMGDKVTSEDIAWEYRDTSFSFDGAPTAEDFAGKRLRQSVRNDEILWKNLLERERAIRRGEMVQVKSGQRGWEITMSVIAQADAFVGDVVSLKNPKTNNVLMGTVVAQGEVELK